MSQYPEDFAKFTRLRYNDYWGDHDNVIMVYECPSLEDPDKLKVVAFSIWTVPTPQSPAAKSESISYDVPSKGNLS